MAEVPKNYFNRFFLIASFAIILIVFWAALQIYYGYKLEHAERDITAHFKLFKIHEESVYLPSIDVAGPNGDIIDLMENDGKYTVLNIWATWCTPCVKELESLRRLDSMLKYDSGWRVVAVSIDLKKNLPKVAKFTQKYKVEHIANYHDYNSDIQKAINVQKLPRTLFLSPSGRIIYEVYGDALWHQKEVVEFLDLVRKVH